MFFYIVACDINCLVVETKWVESQSNRGAWVVTLLSKKSCALTNSYSFCLSGKRSILTIGIKAKVTSSIAEGEIVACGINIVP